MDRCLPGGRVRMIGRVDMMGGENQLKLSDGLAVEELEGGFLVCDPEKRVVHQLESSASELLALLAEGVDEADLSADATSRWKRWSVLAS